MEGSTKSTRERFKMINLENLQAEEAERLAYSEGYPGTARLFARIDDLQRALGQAVAALYLIENDAGTIKHARMITHDAIVKISPVTDAEGII
jgi:hypothetical protein